MTDFPIAIFYALRVGGVMKISLFLLLFLLVSLHLNAKPLYACIVYKVQIPQRTITCQKNESITAPSTLTIGSYNIHWFENKKGLKKDLTNLQHIDVWSLQEVLYENNALPPSDLIDILPTGTWFIATLPLNQEKSLIEGQAIVSKFPLSDVQSLPLQHTGLKKRAALIASIDGLHIINTDHEVQVFSLGFEDRLKQLLSLTQFTNTMKANTQVIILGDFNTAGDQRPHKYLSSSEEVESTYLFMQQNGFSWPQGIPGNEHTFESFWANNFLDHIFIKNLSIPQWNKYSNRVGSDHFPVYVEINRSL